MDCVVNDNYRFSANINCNFIREVEILTDEFLPSLFNPFLFQSGLGEYGRIIDKRFQSVIETILFAFHDFIAQSMPMLQDGGIIERIYCLMHSFFNNNLHASG